MHQTLWLFAVVDHAPKSCFARWERGARRTQAKFRSTIRSTTSPSLGYIGLCPRMERRLVTTTMQLSCCGRCGKVHGSKSACSMDGAPVKKRRSNSPDWIASGRKLDWHVSGHRQRTKCHRGNDEPQLCTCCDHRESTGVSGGRVQRASPSPLLRHFSKG